jgi:hypothetical protein
MATGVVKWFNGQKDSTLFSQTMVGRTCLFTLARSSVRAFMGWPKGRRSPSRSRPIRGAERRALKICRPYNIGRRFGFTDVLRLKPRKPCQK